jgi:hypothetical protein
MLNTADFISTSSTLVYIIEVTVFSYENALFQGNAECELLPRY